MATKPTNAKPRTVRVTPKKSGHYPQAVPQIQFKRPPIPSDFQFEPGGAEGKMRVDIDAVVEAIALPVKTPGNKELIERGKQFEKDLPVLLKDNIASVREFLLTEALPLLTSVESGMAQAISVVVQTLKEEPDVGEFMKLMKHLAATALRVKAVTFMTKLANLSDAERAAFLLEDFSLRHSGSGSANGDVIQTLLRQVLAVSDLSGSDENSPEVLLRQLQKNKDSRPQLRVGSRRNNSKR